jgi:uncharacterized Zn finger protein (UPF0148 family)
MEDYTQICAGCGVPFITAAGHRYCPRCRRGFTLT